MNLLFPVPLILTPSHALFARASYWAKKEDKKEGEEEKAEEEVRLDEERWTSGAKRQQIQDIAYPFK